MSFYKTAALIGNPNCGKTTLFNALTGSHQYVGNWPGVTVEKKSGFFEQNGVKVEVVDLPGVYSLSVVSSASEDEKSRATTCCLTGRTALSIFWTLLIWNATCT